MMGNRKLSKLLPICAAAVLLAYGCAAGISSQARSQVSLMESFDTLQREPERYKGETVMLGGTIIETQVQDAATELTVLQLDLNRAHRPHDGDRSAGRFVVRSEQFLDPALYAPGTAITVVGRILDTVERPIGDMPYRYMVIVPVEIKKWPKEQPDRGPRVHFGIGVGTRF